MAKTIRVSPTIKKESHKTLKCFNITPKKAIENYADEIIYGEKIANKLKLLNEEKEFYQDIMAKVSVELEKIDEEIDNLEQYKNNIDKEMENNIMKAQKEVLSMLKNTWDALNSETYKKATMYKIKDIQKIADKYAVPIKRIFPKEPYKNFYKKTLLNYDAYVDASLLYTNVKK